MNNLLTNENNPLRSNERYMSIMNIQWTTKQSTNIHWQVANDPLTSNEQPNDLEQTMYSLQAN